MDVMNRLFSNDLAPLRFLRDLGLRVVDRAPSLKSLLIAEASGAARGRAEARCADWRCERRLERADPRRPGAGRIDETTRALVPPIHVSSTFIRDPDNFYRAGDVYGRPDNATVREAEAVIGALEGAEATFVFGSGMSAAVALFLSLGPGARIVAPRIMYWALRAWLTNEAPDFGLRVDFVDTEDLDALERAVAEGETKLVWLETPSNPLWGVSDIEGAARIAHEAGALLAVELDLRDAGLHPPARARRGRRHAFGDKISERPFRRLAGALCFAREDALCGRAREVRQSHGLILHPFEAFLLTRGMRTLDLSVRASAAERDGARQPSLPTTPRSPRCSIRACRITRPPTRAAADAGRLRRHAVHPGARRRGGGDRRRRRASALWKRATSLGGVESLIEHRASIEGEGSPCPPDLLRPLGRHRGRRGPLARYRSGACRIGQRGAPQLPLPTTLSPEIRVRAAFKRIHCWRGYSHVGDQGGPRRERDPACVLPLLQRPNTAAVRRVCVNIPHGRLLAADRKG